MNRDQEKALGTITQLTRKHNLTLDDIGAALLRADSGNDAATQENILTRLFFYIGGVFIFAGLCAYTAMAWDDLNSYARVLISFGSGIIALILALACLGDTRYQRAATPLFAIAFVLEPTGIFVFLKEFFDGGSVPVAAMMVFGTLAAQMLLLFKARERTVLVFMAIAYAFMAFIALFGWLDIDGDVTACVLGLSGLLVSYAIDRTPWRGFVPLAYFIFGMSFSIGLYELLESEPPLDILLIAVSGLIAFVSVRAYSRTLLVVGVLSMIGYLGYYTDEYFSDIIGWPIALVVLGFVMIGIGAYAVKLARRISTESAAGPARS